MRKQGIAAPAVAIKSRTDKIFEPILGRQLSSDEVSEVVSNLAGFAKVLFQMKMEVSDGGRV